MNAPDSARMDMARPARTSIHEPKKNKKRPKAPNKATWRATAMSLLHDLWRKGSGQAPDWLPRPNLGMVSAPQAPLCDDLGALEACMGVDDGHTRGSGSAGLGSLRLLQGRGSLQKAMQLAQDKMRALRCAASSQPAVESSDTFAEAERQVGSAQWCGLQCGEDATPTQLAAAQWAARRKALAHRRDVGERSESSSEASSAETVREHREHEFERKPISLVAHTVSAIDNISGLCLRYDISAEELLASNKPATRMSLLARKVITIPVFAEAHAAVTREEKFEECTEATTRARPDRDGSTHNGHFTGTLDEWAGATVTRADIERVCEETRAPDASAGNRGITGGAVPRHGLDEEAPGSAPDAPGSAPDAPGMALPAASSGVRLPSF
jgi:hypothetical protein